MKLSSLVQRTQEGSDSPAEETIDPWAIHSMAMRLSSTGEAVTILSIGQEVHETTPATIVNAAISSLQAGRHHYADIRGDRELRAAIADYHQRLTGQRADESMVTVFAGAQNALFSLAQVLLETGDDVILIAPYYTTYRATFGAPGASVITVEVDSTNQYELDEKKLLNAVTERTRVIVLNAPSNPLGSHYKPEQLERIVQTCVEKRIWLILDAVYLDIVDPESIALPHQIPGASEVLITVGSLSKSHRMTGWRIGWAVGPDCLSEHLYNLSLCMHYGLPPFIQDAAIVAIEQCANTPVTVRTVMNQRRALAVEVLKSLPASMLIDPGQGMFLLLDVKSLGVTAHAFALALLDTHRVSVLPCDGFGPGGRYLVRIGLCVDGTELQTACGKIVSFIEHRV